MSFDDLFRVEVDEPEPEPPTEHQQPQWHGPLSGELPVAMPLGLILARSERGVVAVSHVLVHSSGFKFELVALVRGLSAGETHMIFHEQHAGRVVLEELPKGFLRFGIELPDGQRVSNLERPWRRATPEQGPSGPVLTQSGSSGTNTSTDTGVEWSFGYWLWPLPAAGVLRLFCEWPIAEIDLTSVEVDTTPLLEAAANVARLWPVEDARAGAWTQTISRMSTSQMTVGTKNEPDDPDGKSSRKRAVVSVSELEPLRAALLRTLSLLDDLDRRK